MKFRENNKSFRLQIAGFVAFIYSAARGMDINNLFAGGDAVCKQVYWALLIPVLLAGKMGMEARIQLEEGYPAKIFPAIQLDVPSKGTYLRELWLTIGVTMISICIMELVMRVIRWIFC